MWQTIKAFLGSLGIISKGFKSYGRWRKGRKRKHRLKLHDDITDELRRSKKNR